MNKIYTYKEIDEIINEVFHDGEIVNNAEIVSMLLEYSNNINRTNPLDEYDLGDFGDERKGKK